MAKTYATEHLTLKIADESDVQEIVQFVGRNWNHLSRAAIT
jgi:hypothetical protein